ncbi:MAG: TetR/AcrR family transcriptional regulator [Thermoanaerobaculales bacterium]|nr:TetR/AcrR family transcriptional regulator [Thermoanaerobaculales bacterium]
MAERSNTRERLIRAASELFWAEGYNRAGVNAIIRRAEATSGSFYHFFPTKEDLLLAVLARAEGRIKRLFSPTEFGKIIDPTERLFAGLGVLRQELGRGAAEFCFPMAALSAELSDTHPRIRDGMASVLRVWVRAIQSLLEEGANGIRNERDLKTEAHLIFAAVEGAALQAQAFQNLDLFDESLIRLHVLVRSQPDDAEFSEGFKGEFEPPVQQENATQDWRSW